MTIRSRSRCFHILNPFRSENCIAYNDTLVQEEHSEPGPVTGRAVAIRRSHKKAAGIGLHHCVQHTDPVKESGIRITHILILISNSLPEQSGKKIGIP